MTRYRFLALLATVSAVLSFAVLVPARATTSPAPLTSQSVVSGDTLIGGVRADQLTPADVARNQAKGIPLPKGIVVTETAATTGTASPDTFVNDRPNDVFSMCATWPTKWFQTNIVQPVHCYHSYDDLWYYIYRQNKGAHVFASAYNQPNYRFEEHFGDSGTFFCWYQFPGDDVNWFNQCHVLQFLRNGSFGPCGFPTYHRYENNLYAGGWAGILSIRQYDWSCSHMWIYNHPDFNSGSFFGAAYWHDCLYPNSDVCKDLTGWHLGNHVESVNFGY